MSKAAHTAGPWSYSWETESRDWAIVTDPAGSIIANVNTETGPDAQSAPATRKMPAEANARLIAAAPELLAALDAMESFVSIMIGVGPDAVIPETVNSPLGIAIKIGDLMRTTNVAIAAAKGGAA